MNNACRRQVAMIKAEIRAAMERLEIINQSNLAARVANNLYEQDDMAGTTHLTHAGVSLQHAIDHLENITEWN